jgi:hypothetical protein
MRRLTAIGPILLAHCLALSSGCCWQGYVLHGDWSLGLSHPSSPGCQSAAQGNCPDCGCPNPCGCPSGSPCGCPNGSSCGCPNGNPCGPEGAKGKRCALGSRSAHATATAGGPGPTGPALGHPRFHPVPTRPVFGSGAPAQVVPVVAPEASDPELADPEEVPRPQRAPASNSARRRRPAVRHASVQVDSGFGRQQP